MNSRVEDFSISIVAAFRYYFHFGPHLLDKPKEDTNAYLTAIERTDKERLEEIHFNEWSQP